MLRFRAIFGLSALLLAGSLAAAEPAPALSVPTLSGAAFDLSAQRGHVVIVNFWATWCVPCRAEMPMLDSFYKKHHGEGLEMIGLSIDTPSALAKVKQAAGTISYPVAVARDAKSNGFPAPNALPVTYVIDAQGKIATVMMPENGEGISEQKLAETIEPLLKSARP